MRILGVDYGRKRVGLAISDETGSISFPLEYIKGGQDRAVCEEIERIARQREATQIVVGVPLGMDGLSTEQTERTLAFVAALRQVTSLHVDRWDERLTSVQAERVLIEGDVRRKHRKGKIDKIAAQIMLQSYLDAANTKRPQD